MIIPNRIFFEEVERLIAAGENVILKMKGESMLPFLREKKDKIVLSPCRREELLPGEVVLFRYHGRHILHRIVGRNEEELLIQGDGSLVNHEKVSTKDVVGIVRSIIRPGGKEIPVHSTLIYKYWHLWYSLLPYRRFILFILKPVV
ncbi:MAG: S24/S26 family peptidase [Bacteroidales bacterium]|jgi:hypothetical protein|nr:S24/S26 family peptidase [Bacteroidales bacterium]